MRIPGRPTIDQSTREALPGLEIFRSLPHSRIAQIWRRGFPANNLLSAQVLNLATFITDDWVLSIHGRHFLGCFDSLCLIVNALGRELGTPIEMRLIRSRDNRGNELYRQLDREANLKRFGKGMLLFLSWIASGVVGWLISWWLSGGF